MCLYGFASALSHLAFRRGVSLLLPLHRILPPSQPLQKDNNPSPRTTTLASLVKGRWIDGKAQTVALLHFYLRYIHLFDLSNYSAVKTEGLLYHPSLSTTSMPLLSKVRCCCPKEFGRLPEGLLFYRTLSVSQTPPLTIPQ